MKNSLIVGSIVLLNLVVCLPVQAAEALVDRFSPFRTSRWKISDGWTNGGSFDCSWKGANVRVEGGGLTLSRAGQGSNATCAEVQSSDSFQYGTFETKVAPARGSGLYTSMFLYDNGRDGRPSREITSGILGSTAGEEPVILSISWTPDSVTVYENGRVVKSLSQPEAVSLAGAPMKLFLTVYSRREPWMGELDPRALPAKARFEWFAYTPMGAPCQFPESAVCQIASN